MIELIIPLTAGLSMDLNIGLLWCLAFSVIILFLGALSYFLGRTDSDIKINEKKSQTDTTTTTTNQQQSNRSTTSSNRRKNARKKRQQAAAAAAAAAATTIVNEPSNTDIDNDEEQEQIQITHLTTKTEEIDEEKSSVQPTDDDDDDDDEFEDPMTIESSASTPIPQEEKPFLPIKQRNKNKSNSDNSKPTNSIKDEINNIPITKPQASVAPVKQLSTIKSSTNNQSNQNSKSNDKLFSSSNTCHYSEHNSLPPRFQQRQQKEIAELQKFHKRRATKKSSISPSSAARHNDFIPSLVKQQIHHHNQIELSHQSINQNEYSSESDILTESSSTLAPLSIQSQFSNKSSDLKRSLSSSNLFLDELVSVFDKTSFSNDEIQLILNKLTTKHLSNKQDRQRLSTITTKNDKTIERILDETYRSQTKILAIELQTEKNRIVELSKINTDLDHTLKQLQQSNNAMLPYQQTVLSYQMQIRKLTDDNTHLAHQLHTYSIMPASINELKQQLNILNEQFRHLTTRNSHLEKELADGERARVHAAEIYKKSDTQKQDRIEELMVDINKYKKIEKDLNNLQTKHNQTEKSLNSKLNDLISQRDNLKKSYEETKDQLQQYEQLIENQSEIPNLDELQQQLNETKAKNDLLRQRNGKIIEQINKLKHDQQSEQLS